jgi:hypothetical protein
MFRRPQDDWSGARKLGTYLKDCFLDLTDIGALDLSFGKSTFPIYANLRATKYAEVGGGGWSGYRFGWIKRTFGTWREERHDGLFAVGPIQNYSVNGQRLPHSGIGDMESLSYEYWGAYDIDCDRTWHWADVGGSVHVLFVGVEADVSPYEILDFITGFVTNWPNPDDIAAEMPWTSAPTWPTTTPRSPSITTRSTSSVTTTTRSGRPSGRACGSRTRKHLPARRAGRERRDPHAGSGSGRRWWLATSDQELLDRSQVI